MTPVGDSAVLFEIPDNDEDRANRAAVQMAGAFRAAALAGVRDVVPGVRSVLVHVNPARVDLSQLDAVARLLPQGSLVTESTRSLEIPVRYGGEYGPDLRDLAALAGLSEAEVVSRHADREYRVYLLGFLPGFAYLGGLDPRLHAARRADPRPQVPAGSVGIAGAFTGIYPNVSPGGWRLIGRTDVQLFDAGHSPAALLAPGDRVRFRPVDRIDTRQRAHALRAPRGPGPTRRAVVLDGGLLTTVQDLGRWGHQALGVPVSGAMDLAAHVEANLLVGNAPEAATLEVTVAGPTVRWECDVVVGVSGADFEVTTDSGTVTPGVATRLRAGSVLAFGTRRRGARAYLACDGGVDVPPVLGSRATDVTSAFGGLDGRRVRAGDVLPLGPALGGGCTSRASRALGARARTCLRVLPGPHAHLLPPRALEWLLGTSFTVTPSSNRMAYRLHAARPLPRVDAATMATVGTVTGGIQVPPSGEPILLMSDRQVTGGYPQLAVVITADLSDAAQLAPGDELTFELTSDRIAREALADAHAALDAAH